MATTTAVTATTRRVAGWNERTSRIGVCSSRTAPSDMRRNSPRRGPLLPLERRKLELAQELDLVHELDAVRLPGPSAGLGHQGDRIGRARAVRVLDEVGVSRRDHRAADLVAFEPARLEHAAGAQLVIRILEDAAVRPLVRGLRRLPLLLESRDDRLDLVDGPR